MARITDTPLFKAVAQEIKSISKRQLAKELAIVKKAYQSMPIGWHAVSLNCAFLWDETPQGWHFWNKLDREYQPNT